MSEPFLGEIRSFGFNFAPRGWAMCDGQELSIAQNLALFSLLGTFYGGDGQVTFALPDLRGRVPIHFGEGPGLSNYHLAQKGGKEKHVLVVDELPAHDHGLVGSKRTRDSAVPTNAVPSSGGFYDTQPIAASHQVAAVPTKKRGSNAAHNNVQPYLALNFCIAIAGIYPSRS